MGRAVVRMVEGKILVVKIVVGMCQWDAAEGRCWSVVRCTTPVGTRVVDRRCCTRAVGTQVGSSRILERYWQ